MKPPCRTIVAIGAVFALQTFAAAAQDPVQSVQAAATPLLALYRSAPAVIRTLFARNVSNEFFPLVRGTTFFYEGTKDGAPTRDEVHVTNQTIRILNINCTVVRDRAFEDNVLVEDTFDYYAQDISGNVWYFGEDTKELDEKGRVVSTQGTWRAGVNGAAPGLIMEAHPLVGDRYYQELAAGVAEDQANVRSLTSSTCVPFDCFHDVLRTRETSRFEPGVVEQKYYASGIGFIRADILAGGNEHTALVRITHE
ncbi:MAG: hypothetical protein DMF84_13430 [Acidobacteria bacterium]|nr:MAG: hypothetical protein DMF84_13430 [Acidobacteriota bacterium]